VPGFYRLLQAQEQDKQVQYAEEFKTEVRNQKSSPRSAAFAKFIIRCWNVSTRAPSSCYLSAICRRGGSKEHSALRKHMLRRPAGIQPSTECDRWVHQQLLAIIIFPGGEVSCPS
jgi:hypothetical protein